MKNDYHPINNVIDRLSIPIYPQSEQSGQNVVNSICNMTLKKKEWNNKHTIKPFYKKETKVPFLDLANSSDFQIFSRNVKFSE